MQALDEGIDPATLRVKLSPFVRWLFAQADRADRVGHLAMDAKDDLHFPRAGSESEVAEYLLRYGGHVEDALEDARVEFRQEHPRRSTYGRSPTGMTINLNEPSQLTMERVEQMLVNGDDNHHNQVRVTKEGIAYLSQDVVGAVDIDNLAFRLETFAAGNGYVGPGARGDANVRFVYESLRDNWLEPRDTYIDW